MRYDDEATCEQAQRQKSFFTIVDSIINKGHDGSSEYQFGVVESQPMLFEVALILRLIPFAYFIYIVALFVGTKTATRRKLLRVERVRHHDGGVAGGADADHRDGHAA